MIFLLKVSWRKGQFIITLLTTINNLIRVLPNHRSKPFQVQATLTNLLSIRKKTINKLAIIYLVKKVILVI